MSRYTPLGEATGGFGTVVFCHDRNLDRKVAVKFVTTGEHRRLLDELAALQRIRSKHVAEIFDVVYLNLQMGIVMEYVDGSELTAYLGTPPDDRYLRLLYQMSTGLADIHAVKMIHRDVKPKNMLVDQDGILKIIDFNLSRPTTDAQTHGFVGTRGYAAPELYRGGTVTFDEKIDIYALGVTAYVLLAGKLPELLEKQPPEIAAWRLGGGGFAGLSLPFDRELIDLLDACLDEDPSRRPAASDVSHLVGSMLLRERHRALFATEDGTAYEVNADRKVIRLKNPTKEHTVEIRYTGREFRVETTTGEVWANNVRVVPGFKLPSCCVIALGGPELRAWDRLFITMDLSHPEVVL